MNTSRQELRRKLRDFSNALPLREQILLGELLERAGETWGQRGELVGHAGELPGAAVGEKRQENAQPLSEEEEAELAEPDQEESAPSSEDD